VFNTALTALLSIVLWLVGRLTIVSALTVLGIGVSLVTFLTARRLLPQTLRLSLPDPDTLRQDASASLRFSLWLWLANILAVLAVQADVLLLNRFSPVAMVGSYGLALSLATKVDIINRSLYTVLLPTASALRGREDYIRYLK